MRQAVTLFTKVMGYLMLFPPIFTWVVEGDGFASNWIECDYACILVAIATLTRKGQIVYIIGAATGKRNDMLNAEWVWAKVERTMAIFTTVISALGYKLSLFTGNG